MVRSRTGGDTIELRYLTSTSRGPPTPGVIDTPGQARPGEARGGAHPGTVQPPVKPELVLTPARVRSSVYLTTSVPKDITNS